MKNKIKNYIAFTFLLLSFNGIAQAKYELIKINPEFILLGQSRHPYSDSVKRINLILQLQEKGIYYSSSDDFFKHDDIQKKKIVAVKRVRHIITTTPKITSSIKEKPTIKVKKVEKIVSVKSPVTANDADKLNSALKIPLNSKALNPSRNAASFGPSAVEMREMAFKDIKKDNPEIQQKAVEKQQRSKNLMWAGLILVILGGVMGLVFGRSAFLISLAGVVFAAIGYFFRI